MKTRRYFYDRVVEELKLDTSDPFTRIIANACALGDLCDDQKERIDKLGSILETPIPMLLYCPRCHEQHVDRENEHKQWFNPPHATHTCAGCGLLWRPCNRNTTGVSAIEALEPHHGPRIAASDPAAYHWESHEDVR